MKKTWDSTYSISNGGNRQAVLDLLFCFVNANEAAPENEFLDEGLRAILSDCPALHPDDREKMSKIDFPDVRDSLRYHLRTRLDTFIENGRMLWDIPLWKIDGALEWSVHPFSKRIGAQFLLKKSENGEETETLKSVLDLRLIEIIQGMDLRLDRFRNCPKCGAYFYQKTGKAKTFCSVKCGNAIRVQKFREKRRDE